MGHSQRAFALSADPAMKSGTTGLRFTAPFCRLFWFLDVLSVGQLITVVACRLQGEAEIFGWMIQRRRLLLLRLKVVDAREVLCGTNETCMSDEEGWAIVLPSSTVTFASHDRGSLH